MELTNEQRKYLGLELVDSAWERVEISNSIKPENESGRVILYFDGDIIRKKISIQYSGSYQEDTVYLKTLENRTMIAPKTGKGTPKKLNAVNLQRYNAEGMYFFYSGYITLGNYTTQNRNILAECIKQNSNAPYWANSKDGFTGNIRNPKYENELVKVMEQMGIEIKK